jgi:hydrogenase maturation protease
MTQRTKHIEVLVLGLGNELMTDDGVGVHVIRALQKTPSIEGIEILEVGTAILHAQHLLELAAHVIAVDAVRAGDRPGTVYRFGIEQARMNHPASLHDLGIVGVLQLMPEHARPATTILGVEPDTIDYGMELSPSVQSAVPDVVQHLREMVMDILPGKTGCRGGFMENDLNTAL